MHLEPLKQFICDECSEIIKNPKEGWLEWKEEKIKGEYVSFGFRIVHHALSSPNRQHGRDCYYPNHYFVADLHLDHCMQFDGLVKLLSLFSRPLKDQNELIEIIRRLHIPHYEEARLYWHHAERDGYFAGANEYWPYVQESLLGIIKKYRTPKK